MARVTLFHTSDMHDKLTPALAARLHDLKESHPDSLMLDSGDAIWAGNIFWRRGGEPILDLMNSVPYKAMCVGNREFHFRRRGLTAKIGRAQFPFVSANLRASVPGLAEEPSLAASMMSGVMSFVRFRLDPIVVAVFGLSVPCITQRMLARKVSDFYFDDPVEAAAQLVPKLRPGCDLLVALSHIGLKRDIELAEQVKGIDLILGGHTHTITQQPERVGDAFVLHSGHHAHFVRKVDIKLKAGKVSLETELISLGKA